MDPIKVDKFYLKCFGHEDYLGQRKANLFVVFVPLKQ